MSRLATTFTWWRRGGGGAVVHGRAAKDSSGSEAWSRQRGRVTRRGIGWGHVRGDSRDGDAD